LDKANLHMKNNQKGTRRKLTNVYMNTDYVHIDMTIS